MKPLFHNRIIPGRASPQKYHRGIRMLGSGGLFHFSIPGIISAHLCVLCAALFKTCSYTVCPVNTAAHPYQPKTQTTNMKKFLIIFLSFITCHSFAQTIPNFDIVKLEHATDYKTAEPIALQAATYLLTTPFEKNNANRLKSLSFIIKWMRGTPNYSFTMQDVAGKLLKGDDEFLGLYMVAMAKYALENKASSKDARLVKLNAITALLNYCENPGNNLRMTRQLKKLSEAKEKGQLEQAID